MHADLSAVTVHATGRRVDVVLPNTVPIAELTPTIAALCATVEDDVRPAAWTLSRVGQEPFSLSTTLADAAVMDGEVLHLVDPGVWPSPIPSRLDEPVVSTVAAEGEWSSRHLIEPALGVLGAALSLAAAGFVAASPALRHAAGPALLAAVAAVLAAAYLLPVGERRRFSRPALAAGGWGLAAVAGWALTGGRLDATGGCGATITLVVAVLASTPILAPVVSGAALAGSLGAVGFLLAALGLRPAQAATVVVMAGTVLARCLPRLLSERLARRTAGAEAGRVAEVARASRSLLVSLTVGCVAAVVAGSVVLVAAGHPLTIALVAVAGGMLTLRAMTYRFAREAMAPAIGAGLTLVGALLGIAAAMPAPGAGALLLILAGTGTTLLTFVSRGDGVRRAAMWWTLLDVCAAPLTLYSLGVLDALSRSMGGLFG